MSRTQHFRAARGCAIGALAFVLLATGCVTDKGVTEAIGGGPPPEGQAPAAHTLRFSTWSGGDTRVDLFDFHEAMIEMGIYQRWDADNDGVIDAEEFARGAFDRWDVDNDGTVSRAEWQSVKDEWYIKGLEAGRFDAWNRDGEGALGQREFVASVQQTRLFDAWDEDDDRLLQEREFAEEVFRIWDTSGDGGIQKREWDAGVDQWIDPSLRPGPQA